MSEQDNGKVSPLQRPTTDDPTAWEAYWQAQGQRWRTEPEIAEERQKFLIERRAIVPDIKQGIFPFKNINLTRADVEWLLSRHTVLGPIDWKDVLLREQEGLDLRGANLRQVDLSHLPLALLRGGLSYREWRNATEEQRNEAAIRLERADLKDATLNGALLRGAHLEGAQLRWVQLVGADLMFASLEGAYLRFAMLEKADLRNACLKNAYMRGALLDGAYLDKTIMSDANHIGPFLADTRWDNVNLAVVEWAKIEVLGDEYKARQKIFTEENERNSRQEKCEEAVRANRQLAVALQAQGLNEDAARFAYHAQKLQRVVLWRQRKFGQYLFSGFLDLLAGYGYRPGRSVLWYLVTIFAFALTYFALGHLPFFPDAFVFSLTSFHGRGFFPGLGTTNTLHNPLVVIAACEAIIGLVIEISFIATFTQRYFGR